MKINTLTKSLLLVCLMLIGAVESFAAEYQGTGKLDVTKFVYPTNWLDSKWKPNETSGCVGNFNTSGYYVDINLKVTIAGWHRLVFNTARQDNGTATYNVTTSTNITKTVIEDNTVNSKTTLSCNKTGGWGTYTHPHTIAFYVAEPGNVTIRFAKTDNVGANFNDFYFYSPEYQSVGDLNIYKFDYNTEGNANFVDNCSASFNTEGDYMELCLNLPFDGDYAIDFKAAKYTDVKNTTNYEVSIAEGNVGTFTPNKIAFNTNTGGWGKYTVNQTIELKNAKAGKTKVRITYHGSTNAYAANFKYFVLKCTTPASYSRSMSNQWGTICLPFALNLTGEESFAYYKLESASNEALNLVKMTGEIPAGTPAIVRRGNNETSITINAASNTMVTEPTTVSGDLAMKGTFSATTISGADKWYISNNAFWPATKDGSDYNVTVAPYRAWLEGSVPQQAHFRINVMDEVTTAVEAVNALISSDVEFYDINGSKLNEAKQGLNIIKTADGKAHKVIIK